MNLIIDYRKDDLISILILNLIKKKKKSNNYFYSIHADYINRKNHEPIILFCDLYFSCFYYRYYYYYYFFKINFLMLIPYITCKEWRIEIDLFPLWWITKGRRTLTPRNDLKVLQIRETRADLSGVSGARPPWSRFSLSCLIRTSARISQNICLKSNVCVFEFND